MKIQVLGCCKKNVPGFYTTGFLVNDHLLLDAGEIGDILALGLQNRITEVLLTHAHLDHVIGLPFLGDLVFGQIQQSISVISLPEVITTLHQHIFNNQLWPDFTQLPTPKTPIFRLQPLPSLAQFSLGEFEITPFPMHHTVPGVGYFLRQDRVGLLYSGDTGNIRELINLIRTIDRIDGMLIEVSFPDRMDKLASQTGHLTPRSLHTLLMEIDPSIQLWLFHMKPQYIEEIVQECRDFQDRVHFLSQGEILYLP